MGTLTNMKCVPANLWAKEQPPFSVTSVASTHLLITATAATWVVMLNWIFLTTSPDCVFCFCFVWLYFEICFSLFQSSVINCKFCLMLEPCLVELGSKQMTCYIDFSFQLPLWGSNWNHCFTPHTSISDLNWGNFPQLCPDCKCTLIWHFVLIKKVFNTQPLFNNNPKFLFKCTAASIWSFGQNYG